MKIRLGYACLNRSLETSYKNYTYTKFKKELNFGLLDKKIKDNLKTLEKTIDYNIKNNIHFFRISSSLIPLATKKEVSFDYIKKYNKYYEKIAKKIKDSKMRVDFHPDQFCIINSTKKEVFNLSKEILKYHYRLLSALRVKDKILIIHIGSAQFGKEESIKRFIDNFNKLPKYLKKCIAIENDDKIFDANDCLYISKKLNIPFVFDYHHHICNNTSLDINIQEILNTWKIKPKMHFSSPKGFDKKEFRSHNEYIDVLEFEKFVHVLKEYKTDIDIMLEAKGKEEALFKLINEINYKNIDKSTFFV